jgi:hypothetical protein
LFRDFPFNFQNEAQVEINENMYLKMLPHHLLSLKSNDPERIRLASYVLPGYGLPGMHFPNVSLVTSNLTSEESHRQVWQFLAAIRLFYPLFISVAGNFVIGKEEYPIDCPMGLHWLHSYIRPQTQFDLEQEQISYIKLLFSKIQHFDANQEKYRRLITSLTFFRQVTLGFSISFEMNYQHLFNALEALFLPVKEKAKELGERIQAFINPRDDKLGKWLRKEYSKGRSGIGHGEPDFVYGNYQVNTKNFNRLMFVHEILRYCLLKFIYQEEGFLHTHSSKRKEHLQLFIKEVKRDIHPNFLNDIEFVVDFSSPPM